MSQLTGLDPDPEWKVVFRISCGCHLVEVRRRDDFWQWQCSGSQASTTMTGSDAEMVVCRMAFDHIFDQGRFPVDVVCRGE